VCGSSSTRRATSRPSSRSSSARCWPTSARRNSGPAAAREIESMGRKTLVVAGLLVLTAGAFADGAFAQLYKGKTITMIVNYPAGGPTDIEGRIVAQHLPAHIPGKPTIVIKNVGGAGGLIGSNQLGEIARPDGETIGFFTLDIVAQLVGNPALRVSFADFAM